MNLHSGNRRSENPHPLRVWVYGRVSTDEQVRGGISLEMQDERGAQWCQANLAGEPFTLTFVRDEGDSGAYGWKPTRRFRRIRRGLAELVEATEASQVDCAVIYRLDRIARNLEVWSEFLNS